MNTRKKIAVFVALVAVLGVLMFSDSSPFSVLAAGADDVLIVSVRMEQGKDAVITSVTQAPAPQKLSQPSPGEYRLQVLRDGKAVAEQSFALELREMEVFPSDRNDPPQFVKATSTMQNIMVAIPTGGTVDQFALKLFRGGKEIFSKSLDQLPFNREGGLVVPISVKEKAAKLSGAGAPTASSTPTNIHQTGFRWSFIIGIVVVLLGSGGVWLYRQRKGYNEFQ